MSSRPSSCPDANTVDHFLDSVNDLFEHALQHVGDGDMVGFAIHNKSNQNETTQNTRHSETAKEHVPNLVCLQQFCSRCEGIDDSGRECERCGIRQYAFWEDPVDDLLTYICEPRPWVRQIIAIAHNAKAFDLHFI